MLNYTLNPPLYLGLVEFLVHYCTKSQNFDVGTSNNVTSSPVPLTTGQRRHEDTDPHL